MKMGGLPWRSSPPSCRSCAYATLRRRPGASSRSMTRTAISGLASKSCTTNSSTARRCSGHTRRTGGSGCCLQREGAIRLRSRWRAWPTIASLAALRAFPTTALATMRRCGVRSLCNRRHGHPLGCCPARTAMRTSSCVSAAQSSSSATHRHRRRRTRTGSVEGWKCPSPSGWSYPFSSRQTAHARRRVPEPRLRAVPQGVPPSP
mmetsp:Transcript_21943/g.54690  ORF Transcript_21943/g.54690 Transcript_21943/m.54690 type:complete len:205 (+) Transcript_21943:138-752(+)